MFLLYKSNSRPNGSDIVYKPTGAGKAYKSGDALVMAGGVLTLATGTTKPTYISAAEYTAPATGMEPLATYPVLPGMIFKTTFAADGTALAEGTGVTIHTDSAQVTATAGTVAVIERKLGTGAAGSDVLVTF